WREAGHFSIHSADNGVYIFKCESAVGRDWILENGPWDVWGAHLALRLWERDMPPAKSSFDKVPVWVKLMNIPMEYWSPKSLSCLASVLGKPLRMDTATEVKSKINFARIYVEMDSRTNFPEVIRAREKDGTRVDVNVECNWRPLVCNRCKVFDHSSKKCPINAPVPSAQDVVPENEKSEWIEVGNKRKQQVPSGLPGPSDIRKDMALEGTVGGGLKITITPGKPKRCAPESPVSATHDLNPIAGKIRNIEGKLLMNASKAQQPEGSKIMLDATKSGSGTGSSKRKKEHPTGKGRNSNNIFMDYGACWNIRGLNDPIKQRKLDPLIVVHRVAFLGLLETRVRAANKDRVANNLIKGCKGVSNHSQSLLGRIWVLWNPNVFLFELIRMNCRIYMGKRRRELWSDLHFHSKSFASAPWVIFGDFNVSRYPHEHSGSSQVISKAMKEFIDCLNAIEVDDFRQTGNLFSWSNKRKGSAAISNKIDRILGN
ncbi:LOW QUALITY PROTEIN: DUF4283 domain-containing protein, partial [Cephalotus follicularis]